ncbi:FtsX-like permease family protein [Rhodococcus triatomae]|uniref:Putative ABC transport system permease protein n=1 Tax=Rhodococcus triatomae TaxID=300028 RepID=A0A1G8FDA4_9NOCA|nr:FtsX-like permease family protein [Rhodococcus triatomae]QNG19452.1 FtsX-like permease family protein [Rhodococcus triatomae]QNG24634.1 FtsX-like permease family protein [Rhodococcus triatomae]SDH79959.1 putative ABC transport system permease protein [Rhodococcus triatomae]
MKRLAIAQVRAHAGRYLASVLAVVIAVAFLVATAVLGATSRASVTESLAAQYAATDVVVGGDDTAALVGAEEVAALPGVAAVAEDVEAPVRVARTGADRAYGQAVSLAGENVLRWQRLESGRFPAAAGEVAVGSGHDIAVGTELTVLPASASAADPAGSTVRVVGVVDLSGTAQRLDGLTVYAPVDVVRDWSGGAAGHLRIAGDGSRSIPQLLDDVRAAVPDGTTVATGTEAADAAAGRFLGGADLLRNVLLAFGAIAAVVAVLVIANTFAVLLAARTRELALLRCVGATATQVRRSLRIEAAVVGVVASALGVLAGIGLAWAVTVLATTLDAPIPLSTLRVGGATVAAGVAVGILMTLIAASAPGRAATRVAPLAALHPAESTPESAHTSSARRIVGVLVLVAGVGATILGVRGENVLVACAGGLASFLGVVLLIQRIVPVLLGRTGSVLARIGGPVGALAAGNSRRHPRRTSATATALLIGIALTSTLVVGIGTVKAAAPSALDEQFPFDVGVSSVGDAGLPADLPEHLGEVDGVAAVAVLDAAEVTTGDGAVVAARGVEPSELARVARVDLTLPEPGRMVLADADIAELGTADGASLTVHGSAGERTLVVVRAAADQPPLLTVSDLRALADTVWTDSAWLRLDESLPDREQGAAVDRIGELAQELAPASEVTGVLRMRATMETILDTMLLVVGGLLSVAVLIALIGVGNTMALSVVERRRESGLLRALGLTRGGLRALLLWEAVLVSSVAAVLGVGFGLVFGVAGTASVFGTEHVALGAVPWLQLVAIVLAGGGCGLVASLLPAGRAAQTPPVAAIG